MLLREEQFKVFLLKRDDFKFREQQEHDSKLNFKERETR